MSFHFKGLPLEPFASLFALPDAELEARGFRRMVAGEGDTFPCRISLEDVDPGEELLLINYEHQPAHSPYRAKGPIFVSKHGARFDGHDVPPALRTRLLSLRAYDKDGHDRGRRRGGRRQGRAGAGAPLRTRRHGLCPCALRQTRLLRSAGGAR